jgi:Uma2 family endonuclease
MTNLAIYKWNLEEYHKLIESGLLNDKLVELLEGEIICMSPEEVPHAAAIDSLADYLREKLQGKAGIKEAHPITLGDSEPEPDIAVVRLPKTIYEEHHPYSEDIYWVIEVADRTLAKDLEDKARIYARQGIPEYWVLDVKKKQLWVLRQPVGDRYLEKLIWSDRAISPLSFPELELETTKITI